MKTIYEIKGYGRDGVETLLHYAFTKEDAEAWADTFKREFGAVKTTIKTFEVKEG